MSAATKNLLTALVYTVSIAALAGSVGYTLGLDENAETTLQAIANADHHAEIADTMVAERERKFGLSDATIRTCLAGEGMKVVEVWDTSSFRVVTP